MTKRFTSAGAMLAMRAVTGDYFLALGKGQDTTGLLEEATVAGYARQPVTIVARRAIGTNAAAVSFGSFAAAAGRYTHAGLYTARVGGACIWVGPLETPVELVAGGSVTIAAGVLTLRIALVGTEVSAVIAPANTALPLIAGTARVGESLTASTGAWSGTAPLAYAFQWQRGTATIAGATAATYAVQPGDLGQTLRAVVTATNGAGAAQAVSGATAPVSAALIAPANTATPVITGTAQEGEVLTASTGTWSGTAPITYAFQWQRGATPIAGATVASYTVQNADVDRTLRVIVTAANIAGTMEAASASTGQVAAAPLPGITVVTPPGPLTTAAAVAISGSYSGTMTDASLAWEQNGNAVGQPIAITSFSDGSWTATIATPETAGVYRLRATFNGTGPTATSDDVTIGTSDEMNLATFTFDGSGDGADTVVVFGHSFPQGALHPTAAIVLRRADNNAALRTQMTPLATWPDGTVRTAAFAGELPALANGALLPVRLRRDEAHPSPGPALSWSGALTGRSIRIRTWAPGNTTTPLWTYDVGAALLNSTDDWMTGPLAITRRVAIDVPTSATSAPAGGPGPTSLRLVVDVTATKDGMIEVDAQWRNDALHVTGGGAARYGYTIEIDGAIVYDQRPASGAAVDHIQYNWWMRRRGKKGTKIYDSHSSFRPLFRPDYATLVASRFLLPYLIELFPGNWNDTRAETVLTGDAPQLANPYASWGLARRQGDVGGRPEIGYKTAEQVLWAVRPNATNRRSQLLVHLQCEAFAASGVTWRDVEVQAPVMADRWPRMVIAGGGEAPGSDATVLPRTQATGLPAGQPKQNTLSNGAHMVSDQAHRGAHYGLPALLSARRALHDLLAHRAAECTSSIPRFNGTALRSADGGADWRTLTPDHTTGIAWAPRPSAGQNRSTGWQMRDVIEADYVLPDNYPIRTFYSRNVSAYMNMIAASINLIRVAFGTMEFGAFGTHTDGTQISSYMFGFWAYGLATAVRAGLGGPNASKAFDAVLAWRSNGVLANDALQRFILRGADIQMYSATIEARATSWDDVVAFTSPNTPPDWSANAGEGNDYFLNAINNTALAAAFTEDLSMRAAARDALVRHRSERRQPSGLPSVEPGNFQSSAQAMTNLVFPTQWTWRWNSPPVLQVPAAMGLAVDAPAGAVAGIVDWIGPVPRCTTASNANHDAFEIISQPAGNPFSISRGGAIRRSATGSVMLGQQTLRVRARTISGSAARGENETTYWSAPVTVTVMGTAVNPVLSEDQSADVAQNAVVGHVVATFSYAGTTASGAAIVSGNTGNHFSIHLVAERQVEIRVANTLPASPASRALSVTITNAAGTSAPRTCVISVVAPQTAPNIEPETATVTAVDSLGIGEVVATLSYTGSAATPSIISGNTNDLFVVDHGAAGVINLRVATPLSPFLGEERRLGIRATNLAGGDDVTRTVTITTPLHLWTSVAPTGVFLEIWSAARRLASGYAGPLVRVRRASDNAERDIGQDASGRLDEATLTSFVGSSQGFVTRVYGQLYGQTMVQITAASQLEITAPGGMIHRYLGTASRPALRGGGSGRRMICNPLNIRGPRDIYAIGGVGTALSSGPNTIMGIWAQTGSADTLRVYTAHGPGNAVVANRQFGSSQNWRGSPDGAGSANTPLVVAARLERGTSLRVHWNGNSATGTDVSPRLGAVNTPQHQVYATLSHPGTIDNGAMTWSEGYVVANISSADLDSVIAEQRTYFGV